jgi:hypothetical protein
MNLSKSIDFLLENAGPVIQYRLHKEILHDLTPEAEENLLEKIYQTQYFKLVETYAKPNGYIGVGMHSWDNWRGVKLHETPLQNAESAARLLSYYHIPKTHPLVANFVAAMRNNDTLRHEFSYIPPEIPRFENRFIALNSGNSLQALIYTMQAMLGYGDDYDDLRDFQEICLKGFRRVLEINSLDEITKFNPNLKRKYNYPYIESDEYFPCSYTLAMLAYTQNWRTDENIKMLTDSLNHINKIMKPDNDMFVRIKGKYVGPCFALIRPIRAFRTDVIDNIFYRRPLTEMAMCGLKKDVGILRETVENIEEALSADGILKMRLDLPHNKRYSPKNIEYTGAYLDVKLEEDYKRKWAVECDLTFWAVELLKLIEGNSAQQ